jgi:preprotein translocase SecE subunit
MKESVVQLSPAVLISDTRQFLSGVKSEFGKVTWPSRQEYVGGTIGVLIVVALFSVALGAIDFALTYAVKQLIP